MLGAFALTSCAPAGTSEVKFEDNRIKVEQISLGYGDYVIVTTLKNQSNVVSTTNEKHPITTITIDENGDTLFVNTYNE